MELTNSLRAAARRSASALVVAALVATALISKQAEAQTVTFNQLPRETDPCLGAVRDLNLSWNGRTADYSKNYIAREVGYEFYDCAVPNSWDRTFTNHPRHASTYDTATSTLLRPTPMPAPFPQDVNSDGTRSSDDGSYTVFRTKKRTNGASDGLYLRNNVANEYQPISVLPNGDQLFAATRYQWVNEDKSVFFFAKASSAGSYNLYAFDIATQSTRMVRPNTPLQAISGNGKRLVGRNSDSTRIVVRELESNTAVEWPIVVNGRNEKPIWFDSNAVSNDGSYVAFRPTLNGQTTDGSSYVRVPIVVLDLNSGDLSVIAPNSNAWFNRIMLSGDGRYVAFVTSTSDIDPAYENDLWLRDYVGLFRHDRFTGKTLIVNDLICDADNIYGDGGIATCGESGKVAGISYDGSAILYRSGIASGFGEFPIIANIEPDSDMPQGYEDVPSDFWAYDAISRFDAAGIAGQCSSNPRKFCPLDGLRHDVAAQWFVKAMHDPFYTPAPATGTRFTDVPASWWAASWIEDIDRLRIDRGFGATFKPARLVRRAQFAYFLVRAKFGPDIQLPPATEQYFDDVPLDHWAAPYIQKLKEEGIMSGGCDGDSRKFCPGRITKRATAAIYLMSAFDR